ncbi:MAG: 4-(cytidine 5'-diphospho)-2-C-methyl-D-erythritol kinase [Candidatus Zixiibacteriota bacterium]
MTFEGVLSPDGDAITISAPAKINLFLRVLGKRPDGYHDIFSWFQALDLCDHLYIEKAESGISLRTNHPDVPTDSSNLVIKAAELVLAQAKIETGLTIDLFKQIPVAAGLGGGSSDAAATIKGLDKLLKIGLSTPEMMELGAKIGSDVPFFFSSGQAEVTGRGEIVKNIALPVDYRVLLVTPRLAIRAAEAYERLKLDLTEPVAGVNFTCCRKAYELFGVISQVANDLERALRESYPVLCEVREYLLKARARVVRLSGSGPTVFALFDNDALVKEEFASSFVGKGWDWRMAGPVILPHKKVS